MRISLIIKRMPDFIMRPFDKIVRIFFKNIRML